MGKGKGKADLCANESGSCSAASKGSGIVCRYKGFEVLARPDTVALFREKKLALAECLASQTVFADARKSLKAAAEDLEREFEDLANEDICRAILEQGVYQSTTAERKALVEQRRAQIITFFNAHYIDPKSLLPHPATRIDAALTQAKFRVDYGVSITKQLAEARKALVSLLPMKERPQPQL